MLRWLGLITSSESEAVGRREARKARSPAATLVDPGAVSCAPTPEVLMQPPVGSSLPQGQLTPKQ